MTAQLWTCRRCDGANAEPATRCRRCLTPAPDWYTCGTCGRRWDYDVPAGRCPWEYLHEPEPEPDIPEWYWVDGGDAYWLFGDVLLCCPIAHDGTILWGDACEVDFFRIDAYLSTYARRVEAALTELGAATEEMRSR